MIINEQMQFLHDRYNYHLIETHCNNKIKNRIWTEIRNIMSIRGMYLCNNDFDKSIISQKTK